MKKAPRGASLTCIYYTEVPDFLSTSSPTIIPHVTLVVKVRNHFLTQSQCSASACFCPAGQLNFLSVHLKMLEPQLVRQCSIRFWSNETACSSLSASRSLHLSPAYSRQEWPTLTRWGPRVGRSKPRTPSQTIRTWTYCTWSAAVICLEREVEEP